MRSSCLAALGNSPGTLSSAGCDSPTKATQGCLTPQIGKGLPGRLWQIQACLVFCTDPRQQQQMGLGQIHQSLKPFQAQQLSLCVRLSVWQPGQMSIPSTGCTVAQSLWHQLTMLAAAWKVRHLPGKPKLAIPMACESIARPGSSARFTDVTGLVLATAT